MKFIIKENARLDNSDIVKGIETWIISFIILKFHDLKTEDNKFVSIKKSLY